MKSLKSIIKIGILLFATTLFSGISSEEISGNHSGKTDEKSKPGPGYLTLVKMLSWPVQSTDPDCNVDIEGTKPPARFVLKYKEKDKPEVVIDNDGSMFANNGWDYIVRSERGYGFEKAGKFISFDADIFEELQCACGSGKAEKRSKFLVHIFFHWESGKLPVVSGSIGTKEQGASVEPVMINGRAVVYEFTFTRPQSGALQKPCSSKFFALLNFSDFVE